MNRPSLTVTTGWINVTTGCNNRCAWCYKKEDLSVSSKELPFQQAIQLPGFFAGLGISSCILIGGEPTLYPGLCELVNKSKEVGLKEVTVVTNGRLLKNGEFTKQLSSSGLDVFSISVHSSDKEMHDTIARRRSWDDTVSGICNAVATGKKCSLNLIVGEENYDSVVRSASDMLNWGVAEIIVSCAIPCIIGEEIDGSNSLDPRKFAELIDELAKLPKNVVILHELPLCIIRRDTFLKLVADNRLGFGCHIGVGRGLSVSANGCVIPCNSFSGQPLVELFEGNDLRYTPEEFLELWANDPDLLIMRSEANVKRSATCEGCDLWDMCNCGCPITWGYYHPDNYISDSLHGIHYADVMEKTKIFLNP